MIQGRLCSFLIIKNGLPQLPGDTPGDAIMHSRKLTWPNLNGQAQLTPLAQRFGSEKAHDENQWSRMLMRQWGRSILPASQSLPPPNFPPHL